MQAEHRAAHHIAIVVHSLGSGGAQRRLATLANAFVAAGRKVDLVALRGGGDGERLLDPRVGVWVLDERPRPAWKPWMLEGWSALTRWIEKHGPDVVLAGVNTVHGPAAVACGRAGGRRPALVLRASQHPFRSFPWSRPFKRLREPLDRWVSRRTYDRADLIVAVSRETGDALRASLRRPDRCIDLPNPVITPAFTASLGQAADHPWVGRETPLIVAIGRLVWSKRFDVLLDALAIVRRSTQARLIILGEGKARGQLEAQARRLGIADSVALPGSVAEVGGWLAGADLLVSTSAYEGSPGVLIEALAAGVPVVATRCPGGSEELLADGRGGSLVPIGDAAAAAEAILSELGRTRDRAALRELVSPYHVEASAAAYLAALDRAASGGTTKRRTATPSRARSIAAEGPNPDSRV